MARAMVLVVDDDAAAAHAVRRVVEADGHMVRVETNSEMALRILESDEEFDLTFLDVLMPEPTGEEILRRLRTSAPARLRRLVFLTGMAYLVDTWLRGTGVPFIEKPASREKLIATVVQFAKLDAPRGPRFVNMPKKKPSLPDIAELADEDDEEDDTVVTLAKLGAAIERRPKKKGDSEPPDSDPGTDANAHVILVKYVSRKHARMDKRIDRLEKLVIYAMGALGATALAWELIKTFGLHR